MDALSQFLATPAATNIACGFVGYLLGLTTLLVLAIVRDPSMLDEDPRFAPPRAATPPHDPYGDEGGFSDIILPGRDRDR